MVQTDERTSKRLKYQAFPWNELKTSEQVKYFAITIIRKEKGDLFVLCNINIQYVPSMTCTPFLYEQPWTCYSSSSQWVFLIFLKNLCIKRKSNLIHVQKKNWDVVHTEHYFLIGINYDDDDDPYILKT